MKLWETIMEICPYKYNEYLERVKIDGYALEYVPVEYKTEELCKIAVQQDGWSLQHVPEEYRTEELIFMAQQTNSWHDNIPTELTTRIFIIYETMGS